MCGQIMFTPFLVSDMCDMCDFKVTVKVWVSDMGDMWIVEFLDVKSELRGVIWDICDISKVQVSDMGDM